MCMQRLVKITTQSITKLSACIQVRSEATQSNQPFVPVEATQGFLATKVAQRRDEINHMNDGRRLNALRPRDKQLASYLLARRLDGRPVEPAELDLLRRANDSLAETRDHFHIGRANVTTDIKRTHCETARLAYAKRQVLDSLTFGAPTMLHSSEEAGIEAYTGAGSCGEYANVARAIHAGRLKPGEQAQHVCDDAADHEFVVFTGSDETKVVIDAWGEGPAIRAQDSEYLEIASKLTEEGLSTSDTAAQDRICFARGLTETGPRLAEKMEQHRKRLESTITENKSPWDSWQPQPIVRKSFSENVSRALEPVSRNEASAETLPHKKTLQVGLLRAAALLSKKARARVNVHVADRDRRRIEQRRLRQPMLPQLHNEFFAAMDALSLGANIKNATKLAPTILDGARRLREPDPDRNRVNNFLD